MTKNDEFSKRTAKKPASGGTDAVTVELDTEAVTCVVVPRK